MTLSVVLPCYNEEKNIEAAVRDVSGWMHRTGKTGEIIVVNDGSKDGSAHVLQRLSGEIPHVRVITHEKNQGYGWAIRSGCDAAVCDVIVFMDSDGQFHAEDIDRLLPFLQENDFVSGRRRKRADSFVRNAYGKVLGLCVMLLYGLWVRDLNCGLKLFKRSIWPRIRPVHGVEKLFNTEVFLCLKRENIPWHMVDVPHYPRLAGKPTGGSLHVILRMFQEMWQLKKAMRG
jgi:glycosyltransferase involved in cell wall biosynthesis